MKLSEELMAVWKDSQNGPLRLFGEQCRQWGEKARALEVAEQLAAEPIKDQPIDPKQFEGKTILRMDARACNEIIFWFTDGTQMALHIECTSYGLPSVAMCNTCIQCEVSK